MEEKLERVIKAMLAMQRYPWEQGVCAQALYEAGRDDLWIPMAYDAIKRMDRDGRLAMAGGGEAVSDPASNGEVCLRAYEKTKDPFFLEGAKKMLSYLLVAAPRTRDGIICHNSVSHHEGFTRFQLWVDGLYMVPPFLAVMGEMDEALRQIRGYKKHLYDEERSLFFHIKDVESDRFVRKVHWATGNGWALLGLARVIEEGRKRGRSDICDELEILINDLLGGMLTYAGDDGRFHDILDDETSFMDGTSSMMMAACVYRGIAGGYISKDRRMAADKAYEAVSGTIDEYGILHEVCGCPDFTDEGTSAEAQASYIMASAFRKC
jgi:rhamnogalacturonyl hydrolase YesR